MPFTLRNRHARATIIEYGARLAAIETPDRHGRFGHVLLGFDDPALFRSAGGSFGAVLGRYANRIADARFTLDGVDWQLAPNDRGNILHGGEGGFGNQPWEVQSFSEGDAPEIRLGRVSRDGEEGFPGRLTVNAVYRLAGNALTLTLLARTDAPTVVNLSSHPYFNLGDMAEEDVLDHEITIAASHYLPTDARQIPTGERAPVTGSLFDFREPVRLGAGIRSADYQLLLARGYDHCFVLDKAPGNGPQFAARARSPRSGRILEIYTTQPGLQLYSGNNLTGGIAGRGGIAFRQSSGFAMEAQNFPNAPNQPNFPNAVLRPGEEYRQSIIYTFSAV